MREIHISPDHIAIVDDEDYGLVSEYSWRLFDNKRGHRYAQTTVGKDTIRMHRLILGLNKGDQTMVDHKNGNGLDNRRENLRACNGAQNTANSRKKASVSGYRGVFQIREKWIARIGINGHTKYLGIYADPWMAARAYDQAALEHFGQFARLNFPADVVSREHEQIFAVGGPSTTVKTTNKMSGVQ